MYTLYKFHFLNGISEINQLFDDILIIWPAPVEHEEKTCFIGHRCFSKNLFMSIRHIKKEHRNTSSYYFSFFALSNLLTQTCLHFHRKASSLLWTCKMYIYYLLLHLFATLCHILYFDAAKFSIKLFSLVYFSVSVVRQLYEYEIVTETRPIKT